MQAALWKNYTDEEFTWKFNGNPYTFPPGKEIYLETEKAELFTKHLVDRELNKVNLPTNSHTRGALEARCYPGGVAVSSEEALQLNKKETKVKKVEKEEEFVDLKKKKKKV